MNRKQFIHHNLALATATLVIDNNKLLQTICDAVTPSRLSFDLHCHPGRLFSAGRPDFGAPIDSATTPKEMKTAQISGAFFSLVADSKLLKPGLTGITVTGPYKPGEGWAEYKTQLNDMKEYLSRHSISVAVKSKDLKKDRAVTAYLAVEGGDFLEGRMEKLDEAYQDGIRSIQLVHYAPNELGDLQTAPIVHNGLSAFGKAVVRKMNTLGIIIDVAHASYDTVKDVVNITDSPIMLSHSILELGADRPIAKRAISKEHALLVARTGGVIGAWPSGFNRSFDEFVENTLRLVDVVGIDHVGIGTDMDANFQPVLSSYSQFSKFQDALTSKGLTHGEASKIMGKNALRLLKQVL